MFPIVAVGDDDEEDVGRVSGARAHAGRALHRHGRSRAVAGRGARRRERAVGRPAFRMTTAGLGSLTRDPTMQQVDAPRGHGPVGGVDRGGRC